MDSEDGQLFVKNLAYFVRTHEKALANALQLQRQKTKNGKEQAVAGASSGSASSTTISLAEALSRPYLSFSSHSLRPAKLTLTPHHLFYLLSKFEDLGVDVGPMTVRLENLHSDAAPSNYVSFLGHAPKSRGKQSDADSLRSVSSVRSVMSSMSSMWSALTLSNSAAKAEKQMAQYRDDIKYLYSCFTKIPALRLSPDHRARLISGYEEFPFDTAVPLFAFKNFYGWDRLAEQLRSLTVKRAGLDDPINLLQNIVLDDSERRRKRSSKTQVPTTPSTPGLPWPSGSPSARQIELARSVSAPNSPFAEQLQRRASVGSPQMLLRAGSDGKPAAGQSRQSSNSPPRPATARHGSIHKAHPSRSGKNRRSSGSSGSSQHEMTPRHSATDLLSMGILPSSKWRFLRHLSLAENCLTQLTTSSLAPVANTLQSLDLSGNMFTEIPDALASMTQLRALNLSNCMIDSLSSLSRSPLPAITTLNLRSNRLLSLAGIQRLFSLERVDLRENRMHDPAELARLTGIPDITDLYVMKNPFTRTHSNYRITIFNLFRSSPGHVDDVTIDTMGPLYHEKKYLVDRAPEPANKPVVKPLLEDEQRQSEEGAEDSTFNAGVEAVPKPSSHPGHRRTTSDMGPSSTIRRKKAPRRRIVELSQAEQRAQTEDIPAEPPVPELTELPPMPHTPTTESDQPSTPEATPYHTAPSTHLQQGTSLAVRPRLDTAFKSPTPPPKIRDASDDENSPIRSPEDLGSNTDLYRQKVEALKSELGPTWLSALNENESQTRHRSFSPASRTSTVRPDHPHRGVSVGGRTLG
ncbi:hypothetical protein M409DRAFT_49614 [Zasmidium cellare ATCC 36951]|uniref:Leucine-rich repeat-containing protein n=1 Tax=Zasmidium cellare ATCC 36951 TaxID=1080233 RepID=A0A6A6D3U7_ZASCE|nr:uncharacterized protein M409DRAFT_49614 [Zasmidium cellare ATCC 36951]KAF2173128.1 hypothetical protein M409DRAFT_49614 [Zasmidium cellare ATCC 36951]